MSSERESYASSHRDSESDDQRKRRVRQLNDDLRQTMTGGQVLITQGVEALDLMAATSILHAVRQFNQFSPANDPLDEHDFGALDCVGRRIIWKVDYYDLQLEFASPDPADPKVTVRVITIMLASEY